MYKFKIRMPNHHFKTFHDQLIIIQFVHFACLVLFNHIKIFQMETRLKQKRAKKRSWVWSYFDPPVNNNSKCNVCNNGIPYSSSTTPLSYHLNKVHNLKERARKKSKLDFDAQENEQGDDSISNGTDIDEAVDDDLISKKLLASLLNFIIGTNQPLSIVENKLFQELVHNLNKNFKIPSRSYFCNKLLPSKVTWLSN